MTLRGSDGCVGTRARTTRGAVSAVLVMGLLLGSACGTEPDDNEPTSTTRSTTGPTDAAATQTYTAADSGTEVRLAIDEAVAAALETCGGCGYEWRVTAAPDAAVVEAVEPVNEPRPSTSVAGEPPIVGAPTDTVFRFRGVAPGRTTVSIGYFPPAADAPDKTFALTFVVA